MCILRKRSASPMRGMTPARYSAALLQANFPPLILELCRTFGRLSSRNKLMSSGGACVLWQQLGKFKPLKNTKDFFRWFLKTTVTHMLVLHQNLEAPRSKSSPEGAPDVISLSVGDKQLDLVEDIARTHVDDCVDRFLDFTRLDDSEDQCSSPVKHRLYHMTPSGC
ncbi:hypothetical protein F4604DRAFT_1677625 [Suillus subluteus]|nr:hypothetical protein F4604DRAFT_1677625 [Suillus subluteus]